MPIIVNLILIRLLDDQIREFQAQKIKNQWIIPPDYLIIPWYYHDTYPYCVSMPKDWGNIDKVILH